MKKYGVVFISMIFFVSAAAYTRITSSDGQTPKWNSMPVTYWINDKGSPQILNGSDISAIQASFHAWELVPSADVRFIYGGTTAVGSVGRDGLNVVSFTDTATPLGSSTIAATFSFFKNDVGSDGLIHLVVDEADIIFNPVLDFSTSAEDNKFDIQSVLTHEIGHLLGLDHSAMVSSVMVPFAATSQLDQRTLAYDDVAAITEIYPKASSSAVVGQIQGTIRSGISSVFGANVVAVDSGGTPLVSTLSQPDGSYLLRFLPPGTYRVLAEPLDLPVTRENIGGGVGGFYRNIRTDFGTTYFGSVSTLTEAQTVTVAANATAPADIQVLPKGLSGLNLTRPAFGQRMARGKIATLTVGGEDVTAGIVFSASNPNLVLGSPSFGGRISSVASTSARMELNVLPSTPLGPKSIAAIRGADASIATGALVITDANPEQISVAPNNGPLDGGTPVTITGANFRSGAQVSFAGIAATGVRVINPGTILANTPSNVPGVSNVVVMNSDGTWGVTAQAFAYLAVPPSISRVSPLSGPPTTQVTIEGDHFDTRIQNISVQFNGVSARVINSTSTSITTIVPFGSTTGPITVSVFGATATSPVFTVTTAVSSTNVATSLFHFIDASIGSGGTNVGFTNADDAIAFATLPFNFSLFRDIYLSGSRISIATNGFISLEPLSVAEFQNGSLPGEDVVRSGGSAGVIPASLIAPFWDDLVMKSNSVVTTRTLGSEPNRQFVVEWANMSILDEEGRDLNANLTFELVLYEGSYDIQFLYNTMTGPRADGSSATVGAQDLKRVTAVLSGFNQATVFEKSLTTYRFQSGSYVEAAPDSTPPSKPIVTDEGALTANGTQLTASWKSEDAESGVRDFLYAIGTTPGGTDVRAFTLTTQDSIVATGLGLQAGTTYYFAVKATNGVGLSSEIGVSDGIRFDPAYTPFVKIVPSSPQNSSEFTGLAFLSPTDMNVVLRAYGSDGALIFGAGVRNPVTISLKAGAQHVRLVSELFGLQTFDGWIEAEASGPGLGIFTATGAWNMSTLDGSVARNSSTDFVLFHAGASAILVNPTPRTANVTMNGQAFSIPPRGRIVRTLPGVVRVQSSEPLAAVERQISEGKTAINSAVSVAEAQSIIVFPQAVTGGGYTSTLTLTNVGAVPQNLLIACGDATSVSRLEASATARLSIAACFKESTGVMRVGAVKVTSTWPFGSTRSLVGVLDIENETGLVTVESRPAATDFTFPHVVSGNGSFTGLALAASSTPANVTIEVYQPAGGPPNTTTIALAADQQIARFIGELLNSSPVQNGGYIRIHSDQRIWAWELFGSDRTLASAPPL